MQVGLFWVIATRCIAHTPPVNPCFLLLRFQGQQSSTIHSLYCASPQRPFATQTVPTWSSKCPFKIALVEASDTFCEAVLAWNPLPFNPYVYLHTNLKTARAHTTFSLLMRMWSMNYLYRSPFGGSVNKYISICLVWVQVWQTSYPCTEVVSSCLNSWLTAAHGWCRKGYREL